MSPFWKKRPQISIGPEFVDAVAMADAARRRQITPTELIDDAITRIEALNPALNAVIHPLLDNVREAARATQLLPGPFRSVPLIIKDLLCLRAGDPYHLGMAFLRERQWVAQRSSYLTERLCRAGFIIVGRSNTPELGASATTEPHAYGVAWPLEVS